MPNPMKVQAPEQHNYEKLVLENVADIIVITDLDFIVQSWNPIAEFYYRIPESEAIGKRIGELIQFTYLDTTAEEALSRLRKNSCWQGEVSFTNKRGEIFQFSQTVKYAVDDNGIVMGVIAVGRDITEKKRAEQKLSDSEQFYRTLLADSSDTTLLLNADGTINFSTPNIHRLLGYEASEVIGTSGFTYIHPDDLPFATQSFMLEVQEKPEIKFIVVRLRRKTGEWIWCMTRGHNLLSYPHINSIAIYIHDDTPRKLASDALKQSEKRFRNLIRDFQTGVLLQNENGKIEMANAAVYRMLGYNEEDIIGGKVWELDTDVVHEDGTVFYQNERPSFIAMQTRQPVKDVVMGVWDKRKKERVWILINADPILDENNNLVNIVSTFTDITERKKLEKKTVNHQRQLTQATIDAQEKERREIGKDLHDNIGQQLTTVKLYLDLAKTSATPENSDMISMALKGISDVINEIRAMSRSLVPPSLKDLGFIDSINDLIQSLHHIQAISVELDYFEFDEDLIPENKKLALFRIIQEQLNNIMKHAEATRITITLRSNEDKIFLEIKDDGKGFDWSKIRKGLGLTNIFNRAELFGGKAEIFSAPQKGCSVKVSLPQSLASSFQE